MGQRGEVQIWGDLIAFPIEEAANGGVYGAFESPEEELGVGGVIGVVAMTCCSHVRR